MQGVVRGRRLGWQASAPSAHWMGMREKHASLTTQGKHQAPPWPSRCSHPPTFILR